MSHVEYHKEPTASAPIRDLRGLRRFVLVTRDAHGLYEKFGFTPLGRPEGFMEIVRPEIYAPARAK